MAQTTLLLALVVLLSPAEEPKPQSHLLWIKGNNAAAAFIRDSISVRKYENPQCDSVEHNLALAVYKEQADVIVSAEVDPRLNRGKTATVIVLNQKGRILKAFGPGSYEDVSGQLLRWACCFQPRR